jgi:hypothetical protein
VNAKIYEETAGRLLLWIQLTVMMEAQLMETDAAVHVQSNLNGNVQEAPHLSQILAVINEVMVLLFKLF